MNRLALLCVLALAPIVGADIGDDVRVEYRDNARPIRLALPSAFLRVERLEAFLLGPERITALIAQGSRNPTRWARKEGRALPNLKMLGAGYARYGVPDAASMALYWSDDAHHGKVAWRRGGADPERLRKLAETLSDTWRGEREGGWLATAAHLPEGSILQFHFPGLDATLQVFGGPAEAGRREADKRLRRALASGSGWEPMLGMHSPSWKAAPESPVGAVLIAGPVLLLTANPRGPEVLEHVARAIERPLPEPPQVGDDPMGPPPEPPPEPETEREQRWKERERRWKEQAERRREAARSP
jgi:hypothetical protein